MYASGSVKRLKTTREASRSDEAFQGVGKIEYKPELLQSLEDNYYYRYYNANEQIHGRTMADWLRPSIYIGDAFNPNSGCIQQSWCENNKSIESYKRSIRAVFELCLKLGVKYWSGYDRDIVLEGDTFEKTQNNYELILEFINEYQQKTGIRPLWIGVDLKRHNRYIHGAATNPDANIVTYAGFQVKRALDMACKLNAECFLFNGEQEHYENLINSDLKKEMKHYARFLKLMIDYRDKMGYCGQLLLQTVQESNNNNRYNMDVSSTLAFLKHYNIDRYFRVMVGTKQDFQIANMYGNVGSVDVKSNDLLDMLNNSLLLRSMVENGGMVPGGFTFYSPNQSILFESKDLAEAFIVAIDRLAKALRYAIKIINDADINKSVQVKYLSFSSGWGAKLISSNVLLDECEDIVKKNFETMNLQQTPSRTEHWTAILNRYIDAPLK